MKIERRFAAAFWVVAFTVFCGMARAGDTNSISASQKWQGVKTDASNAWQNVKQGSTQTWQNVKQGTTQAWSNVTESLGSASNYTYEKKDEFVSRASADLKSLDERMTDLSNKATNATASVKMEAQSKIRGLRIQEAQLNQKLDDVKNAGSAQWNKAKGEFKDSYNDATNSLAQTWQWLENKVR